MNDNEDPSTTMHTISDEQEMLVIVLQVCSASLSLIGSTAIIFKILRDRANNRCITPYDRIIVWLSAWDIIASITWVIGEFLHPTGTGVWAFGNSATCQLVGFLTQLSVNAWWYNGLLSYFFLLTVVSQVKRKNYVQPSEPWLHLTGAFQPIAAIVALSSGWFGTDSDACWVTNELHAWIIGGFPTLFVYLSVIINYTAIYAIVRKSIQSSRQTSKSAQKKVKKEAATLMILYAAGFVVCITPMFIQHLLELRYGYNPHDSKLFPLRAVEATTKPIQGFFNFLIYIKPVYTRFRTAHPNKSKLWVLQQAVLNPKMPQLHHRRVANNVTYVDDVVITDVSLAEDREVNPNEALFDPSVSRLSSSRDSNVPKLHDSSDQTDCDAIQAHPLRELSRAVLSVRDLDNETNT